MGLLVGRSETRQYERIEFEAPLSYKICSVDFLTELYLASSRNVSHSGISFFASSQPPIGSILKIALEAKTLGRCIRIEHLLFECGDGILGKVIWVKPSSQREGEFEVGVAFIKTEDALLPEVQRAARADG